ncbi:hypothetical protein [Sporomusa sp. KB1]|uniref:hypothetical protein n=1 Tax=Sporomusa sp. KB1 TaxID=943346 RepID=UPI001C976982|nr:hypothetical protein [Sporomusa sp. KB1]
MRLGKTDKAVHYKQVNIDGIEVYYHPTVAEIFKRLTIKIEKIFFFKRLVASDKM